MTNNSFNFESRCRKEGLQARLKTFQPSNPGVATPPPKKPKKKPPPAKLYHELNFLSPMKVILKATRTVYLALHGRGGEVGTWSSRCGAVTATGVGFVPGVCRPAGTASPPPPDWSAAHRPLDNYTSIRIQGPDTSTPKRLCVCVRNTA